MAQNQKESSTALTKNKSNNVGWKNTVLTVIKIVSYFIFPELIVIALIGKAIHRKLTVYHVSNASQLSVSDSIEENSKPPNVTFKSISKVTFTISMERFLTENVGINFIDESYYYPPKLLDKERKIIPENFQSPFSKIIWNSHPKCSGCYVNEKEGWFACTEKCAITWNQAKDELSFIMRSYNEAIEEINQHQVEAKSTTILKEMFKENVIKIKSFLEKDAEKLFHQFKNEGIESRIKLHHVFDNNEYIRPLLFARESELGITANFRGFMKNLFLGIRGEIEVDRKVLADQLNEVIEYLLGRGFDFNHSNRRGEASLLFNHIANMLFASNFVSNAQDISYRNIRLTENESDTSDLLEFCYVMCDDPATHSVGVIKWNDTLYTFDNYFNPNSREYNPEYNEPQVTIRISKKLYDKLKLDRLDLSKWILPEWRSNCYASANVVCFTMMDYIIQQSGGCHIDISRLR